MLQLLRQYGFTHIWKSEYLHSLLQDLQLKSVVFAAAVIRDKSM